MAVNELDGRAGKMMGVSLSDAVFEALSGCLDPAPNTRMTAELQIKHLATNAGEDTCY